MINRLLISVATAALIAGGVTAHAQGPAERSGSDTSPSTSKSAPPSGGAAAPKQRSAPAGSTERAPAADRRADDQMQKGMGEHRSNMKAEDRSDRDKNRAADSKSDRDMNKSDREMKKNADSDRSGNRNADNDRARSSTTTGQAGAQAKLSTEQRTKITTVIRKENIRPETNVNFSISIGTRVPREVHFHPLPTEIVTIYPAWRGYEFFMVRDQIIVVDPNTFEIVAVLDV